MARDQNLVLLSGRLGQDPDTKFTTSGTVYAKFSLAVNRSEKKSDGSWGDRSEPDWMPCVAWGKTAELAQQHLGKGRKIFIEGRLERNDWTDKDGVKHQGFQVVIGNWYFGDSNKNGATGETAAGKPKAEEDDIDAILASMNL